MNRAMVKLRVAILCSTIFIVLSFALSYFLWGHDGLPIGWDTPHYIAQSRIAATEGAQGLLAIQGPYDFLYQLFSGFIVWTGIPSMALEIYLPIALSSFFPYLLSKLTLAQSGTRLATIVATLTPGWYAIYKISADLHANLLGLVLMLTAILLLSHAKSLRRPEGFIGLVLVGLASFTHIETTFFLVTIFLISSASSKALFPVRVAMAAVLVTVPATIIFGLHFLQLLGITGGSVAFYPAEPVWVWLLAFGPLLPLAAWGFYSSLVKRATWLEAFVAVWALSSIVIGATQYLSTETFIFAQRAVILVPVPFLAAIGIERLQTRKNWPTLGGFLD